MNWIKKTLSFSEKIKRSITKRITKQEMADSKWMPACCGSSPILKASIFNDEQVNTCPNCSKHYPLKPRARFDHSTARIIGQKLILLKSQMILSLGLVMYIKKN